jgi:membrane protease YdiL (CAAX protease family)
VTALSTEAAAPPAPSQAGLGAGPWIVVLGAAALLARPVVLHDVAHPTALLVALFVGLGLAGTYWPLTPMSTAAGVVALAPVAAVALGVGAFAVGGLLGPTGAAPLPVPVAALLLNMLAAVAEEAFFRRLLYGLLAPRGTAVAVVGSAVCFAAVHFTVWGAAVLPLDLAAGLILGWQRAATGRWSVPAITHVAANVLAVL